MTKVLLSFSSYIYHKGSFRTFCMYEGLVTSLRASGNQVMAINAANFLEQSWNNFNNHLPKYFNYSKIIADVKKFNPELVIAFNHSIPLEIEEVCECPMVLWASDCLYYFSDKDYIKKYLEKYIFIADDHKTLDDIIEFGANKNQVHMVRFATTIKAETINIKQNISFIGTNFVLEPSFIELLEKGNIAKIRDMATSLVGKFYDNTHEQLSEDHKMKMMLSNLSSTQNRITVLNNLQDLGLTIWGSNWLCVGQYLPWLAMCFNKKPVYSVKHNQDIYNSSKLCVSIAHAQAVDGFPWRTMEIMASNGCLVSDYHKDITDFTKGYVDIPMYDNPYDARDLCKKLLKDDKWRKDIVLGSQKCIEDKGRWKHRFKELEEILNVKLLYNTQKKGAKVHIPEVIHLRRENYIRNKLVIVELITNLAVLLIPDKILRGIYIILNRIFGLSLDQHTITKAKTLRANRILSKKTKMAN